VSIILIIFILVQNKGTGFGRVWGGGSSFTRRGLEKLVFRLTFFLAFIFLVLSIVNVTI
jgi:protein translocase SecG subunit